MNEKFRIDSLDKKILSILMKDARVSYLEVARKCRVSGAAIHQRIQKMTEAGVISGSQFNVSTIGLGFVTQAFIGIQVNLTSTRTHDEVFEKIRQVPEVVECHHTTGKYSLFIKIMARNNEHLKNIIIEKVQSILEVTATETFISLEEGFKRQVPID
jgi:Lrp/AsnC family transcriptional regulator for asnA, asnC and gidA